MYHSVTLWLSKEDVGYSDFLNIVKIPQAAKRLQIITTSNGIMKKWRYKHLTVTVTQNKIKLQGALPEFYYAEDFTKPLSRTDTKLAINEICSDFQLDFHKAKVTKLEIGHNFAMDYPVASYYPYLAITPGLHRSIQPNGIYFKDSPNPYEVKRVLIFYDKIQEKKNKGNDLSLTLPTSSELPANLLRYELLIKERVNEYFGREEVRASDLYTRRFYTEAWSSWVEEFMKLTKCNQLEIDPSNPIDAKDFLFQYLMDRLKNQHGEDLGIVQSDMFSMVNQLEQNRYFQTLVKTTNKSTPRQKKSEFNRAIKKAFTNPRYYRSMDKMVELEKKIRDTAHLISP